MSQDKKVTVEYLGSLKGISILTQVTTDGLLA
jgi:hypothetical protein